MSDPNYFTICRCRCGWEGRDVQMLFNSHPADHRLSCPRCGVYFGYGCPICHTLITAADGLCPGDSSPSHGKILAASGNVQVVINSKPYPDSPSKDLKFTVNELRAIEDSVKKEIDGQDELRQAVSYAYYNGLGWRMTRALQVIDKALSTKAKI